MFHPRSFAAVGLLLASFAVTIEASPLFVPSAVPNALSLIYPAGPVTQGSAVTLGFNPPSYQGVWANISLSIIFPNHTTAGLIYASSVPSNDLSSTSSPQACGYIALGDTTNFQVTTPGTYGLFWTETLYFPKTVNVTDVSVMCSGGIASTEVSSVQRTFSVVASSNSAAQPTIPANTVAASFSTQPTGTVYVNTGSSSSTAAASSTTTTPSPSTSHKPNGAPRGTSLNAAAVFLPLVGGGLFALMI